MINNIRNFCIIAHIDHGKSTLADRFLELTKTVEMRNMKNQYLDRMDLERERGITIKLQPVRMIWQSQNSNVKSQITNKSQIQNYNNSNDLKFDTCDFEFTNSCKEFVLNMIDTPGHVDFSYEVSRSLAAVEGALLLVDATQGVQAQTIANLYQAIEQGLDIIPVINKIDLPAADIEKVSAEIVSLLGVKLEEIFLVSAKTGEGVENILNAICEKIRPPKYDNDKTRALIFDSVYDSYRGVVAYVRLVDGEIKKGDRIKFISTNADDEALEVGVFKPEYQKTDKLGAGEIGYIVTGLKEINDCRVGDTITLVKDTEKNVVALPGYKEIKPMVYASIYPADGDINKLREALGKLKLNDYSLTYEPENSQAFGFGFKAGFLGLLHMEIIKERLEREYNLDVIVTIPQVNYQTYNIGQKIEYKEPWATLDIVTKEEYLGNIMELAQRSRAIYVATEYLADRVLLKYEAPLSSIIVNFYDKLKSVSAGYASMNYHIIGYRSGDLVKMDVLVAGDKIDVLSQVVHQTELHAKAHEMVTKLKEFIPKQMFQVSLQAAVGGKILARENIAAMKKDVAGYLYGGDISRKKKLWAKQARGKEKMKKLGRVEIPTDVFIKLLKY